MYRWSRVLTALLPLACATTDVSLPSGRYSPSPSVTPSPLPLAPSGASAAPPRPSAASREHSADAGASNSALSDAQVRQVVTAHALEARGCFDWRLLVNPELRSAEVVLGWQVDAQGAVASAKVLDAQAKDDPGLADCMMHRLLTWSFPASDGVTDVARFSFRFGPGVATDAGAQDSPSTLFVETDSPPTLHGLGVEQVRRVVVAHVPALRACYDAELRVKPGLRGGVTMTWVVAPDGSVSSARVGSSTINDARVEDCIVRLVSSWRFPASDGVTNVSAFPFRFGIGN